MSGSSLGKLLSEEQRKNLANQNLIPGAVLKFYCQVAQKEKFLVYVGQKYDGKDICFVHINSEINEKIFNNPRLKNEHYQLLQSDYFFLSWDSYTNCSQLIIYPKTSIYNLLVNDPGCHHAHLTDQHFTEVKERICKSRILTPSQKKEYGLFHNC